MVPEVEWEEVREVYLDRLELTASVWRCVPPGWWLGQGSPSHIPVCCEYPGVGGKKEGWGTTNVNNTIPYTTISLPFHFPKLYTTGYNVVCGTEHLRSTSKWNPTINVIFNKQSGTLDVLWAKDPLKLKSLCALDKIHLWRKWSSDQAHHLLNKIKHHFQAGTRLISPGHKWLLQATATTSCTTVILQWYYSDTTVILQWYYSDTAVILQWYYSDTTVILQWHYSDTTVILQWYYSDTTVTLQWYYSDTETTVGGGCFLTVACSSAISCGTLLNAHTAEISPNSRSLYLK